MQGVSVVDERCKKRKKQVEKTTMESSSKKNLEIYKKRLKSDRLRKQHSKIIKSFSSSSSNSQSPTSSQPSPSLLPVPTTSSLTPVIASHHQQSAYSTNNQGTGVSKKLRYICHKAREKKLR